MAVFIGTNGGDFANAVAGILTGFTGGSIAALQDTFGDSFEGNQGSDTVIAGSGNDTINGEIGADFLDGGGGDDFLVGGENADTLIGSDGKDFLDGGDGADTIRYDVPTDILAGETISGGNGVDTLQIGLGQSFNSPTGFDFRTASAFITLIEELDFEQNSNTVNVSLAPSDIGPHAINAVDGSAGVDIVSLSGIVGSFSLETLVLTNWTTGTDYFSLLGTSASESIVGSSGDDRITGNTGQDTVRGGDGDDRFRFGSSTTLSGVIVRPTPSSTVATVRICSKSWES